MTLFEFLHHPNPWSWFIADDPNPQLSEWDLRDLRKEEDE